MIALQGSKDFDKYFRQSASQPPPRWENEQSSCDTTTPKIQFGNHLKTEQMQDQPNGNNKAIAKAPNYVSAFMDYTSGVTQLIE